MKVLIVSESYPPKISGVAVFTQELIQFLVFKNQKAVLFTNSPSASLKKEKNSNLTVYYFPSIPNPFRRGFRVSLPQKKKIEEILAQERPDIVHCQDPSLLTKVTLEAANRLNIPSLITHHFTFALVESYLPDFLKKFARRRLVKYLSRLYQKANLITCPSQYVKQQLSVLGLSREIKVVSNGVNLKRFFADKARRSKHPLVLYVGRLDPEKEVEVVLKAAQEVLRVKNIATKNIEFYFVGKGTELEKFCQEVKKKKLGERIHFFSALQPNSQQLIRIYQKAWVFWTASRSESQGIVVLEALASGLPVIAPNAGGIPEMIRNNFNGCLVKANTPIEFKEKLLSLLNSPARYQKIAGQTLATAKKYELVGQLSKFLTIYKQLRGSAKLRLF